MGGDGGVLADSQGLRSSPTPPAHTGDPSPGFSKEIAAALAGVPGFEVSAAGLELGLGLEEELHMEPLGLEGLNMLSDPCALLPDPAVEDSFRSDRLQ